jgi:hypothetical protein
MGWAIVKLDLNDDTGYFCRGIGTLPWLSATPVPRWPGLVRMEPPTHALERELGDPHGFYDGGA